MYQKIKQAAKNKKINSEKKDSARKKLNRGFEGK